MMMTDYFGWIKRNIKNMSEYEMKKQLKEAEEVQRLLKNNLKLKGAM